MRSHLNVFYSEHETINHLFFDCVVAKIIWQHISSFFNLNLGENLLSIARYWPASKYHAATNSVCASVLWSIWKLRNAHIFNNATWVDMNKIWCMIQVNIMKWMILFKENHLMKVENFFQRVSLVLQAPFQLEEG